MTTTPTDEFRLVAADGPEVQPLLADLLREYDDRYGDTFGDGAATELARYGPERFVAPDGAFLVLLRDGVAVAGGAFLRRDERTAEVKRVWTSAELRGQGIAKRLLGELENEARRRGYSGLYLTTGPKQPEAVRLYLGAGFTPLFDPSRPATEVGVHAFTKRLDGQAPEPAAAAAAQPAAAPANQPAGTPAALPAGIDLAALARRKVLPVRHPLRWVVTALVLVLVLNFGQTLFSNPAWEWSKVGTWLFHPAILAGLRLTLLATAISAVVSFVGGVVLALARLSRNPVLSTLSWLYIWVFRSIPLLLVLVFLYNLGNLYPAIGIGVPFGPQFEVKTVTLLSDLTLGVVGLSLAEIAYSAEIVRAGILAVDQGQHEAAKALGLPRRRQFTRIVLPQALRSIVPAYVNQIVGLLKASSLLFYVSLLDLFGVVQNLGSTYPTDIIPLLVVAAIWYLVFTSVISVVQHFVERYYARGSVR